MGWTATVHYHPTLRQWYARLRGHCYYFGRDRATAHKRFAVKLVELGIVVSAGEPVSVSGAALAWWRERGSKAWERDILAYWTRHQGHIALDELPPDLFKRLILSLDNDVLGAQTIRHVVSHAMRVCRWSVGKGYLERVPDMPELPVAPVAPRDVAPDALKKAFGILRMPIYRFCLETGCRPSEACRLEWSHVRLDQQSAELPPDRHKTGRKTGRTRTIYLSPGAVAILEKIAPRPGPVFINTRGNPYTAKGMRSTLRHHAITPYQLRHTFAQMQLEAGVPMEVVAGLLGHKGLRMVQRYAQVRDPALRKVASAIKNPLADLPQERTPRAPTLARPHPSAGT